MESENATNNHFKSLCHNCVFPLVGPQAFLVGIVVPDPEVMPSWAQKRGIEGTYAELCANKVCTWGPFPERLPALL